LAWNQLKPKFHFFPCFLFLFKVYKTKWLDSERKNHLLVWAPPLDPLLGFAYRWLQLFYKFILPALCNYLNLSNRLGSCSEIDFYWIHFYCPWSQSLLRRWLPLMSLKQDNTVKAVIYCSSYERSKDLQHRDGKEKCLFGRQIVWKR